MANSRPRRDAAPAPAPCPAARARAGSEHPVGPRRRAAPEARQRADVADRPDRDVRVPGQPGDRRPLRGPRRARRVRPVRQPHPARGGEEARGPRGRPGRSPVRERHGGHHHDALRHAVQGRPRRRDRRRVPAHPAVPQPGAAPLRRRGHHGARGRLRADGGGDPADDAPRLQRVADEPVQPRRRPRAPRRDRAPPPGEDGHRLHLRDPDQPAAARVRGRPRHPLRDQVPRRPQRPDGRRRPGEPQPGRRHPRPPLGDRRRPRPLRGLPAHPGHQDPGASRGAARTRTRSAWPSSSRRTRRSSACTTRASRATRSTTSRGAR